MIETELVFDPVLKTPGVLLSKAARAAVVFYLLNHAEVYSFTLFGSVRRSSWYSYMWLGIPKVDVGDGAPIECIDRVSVDETFKMHVN